MTEIKDAMASGEDTTGLCTIRDLARDMIKAHGYFCELYFDIDGKRVNVEVKITRCVDAEMSERKNTAEWNNHLGRLTRLALDRLYGSGMHDVARAVVCFKKGEELGSLVAYWSWLEGQTPESINALEVDEALKKAKEMDDCGARFEPGRSNRFWAWVWSKS